MSTKPDIIDTKGQTPLHYRFKNKNPRVQLLFSHDADISTRDNQSWTPLHVTSYYGVGHDVSSLLTVGARADARDDAGMDTLDH